MSKRHSARLSETPDDNIANFANKRVRTELEMQNTTNAEALKKSLQKRPMLPKLRKWP
ncbi:unnamed protein product [Tenebrio molitor]|nr:unnamed protein product [Tenebrio molitor]